MTTIVFVTSQGERMPCSAATGTSLMFLALTNGIDGVLAECGGSLACGTCHVYIEETKSLPLASFVLVAPLSAQEDEMLDATAEPRRPNSRLSCQLKITEAMDGLSVHIPARQV